MNTVRMNVLFKNGAQRTFSVEPDAWKQFWDDVENERLYPGAAIMIDKKVIIRVDDVSAIWVDETANNV